MKYKKKIIIGLTCGVYDLFHYGHVRMLQSAKALCDKLIVGLSSDELVKKYKNKNTFIKYNGRKEVLDSCMHVDLVIKQNYLDKVELIKKTKADILIVGDDWYGDKNWKKYEQHINKIIYLPYTKTVSTTKINLIIKKNR